MDQNDSDEFIGFDGVSVAMSRACGYVLDTHRDENESLERSCERIIDMIERVFLRAQFAERPGESAHQRMRRQRMRRQRAAAEIRALAPDYALAWEAREMARLAALAAAARARMATRTGQGK